MLHVTLYQDSSHGYVGFKTSGHAEMEEEGKDILCAAVSVLIINTMNAIESFTKDSFLQEEEQKTGTITYRIQGVPSKETCLLLDTLVLGLEQIAGNAQYKPYIVLEYKEVGET